MGINAFSRSAFASNVTSLWTDLFEPGMGLLLPPSAAFAVEVVAADCAAGACEGQLQLSDKTVAGLTERSTIRCAQPSAMQATLQGRLAAIAEEAEAAVSIGHRPPVAGFAIRLSDEIHCRCVLPKAGSSQSTAGFTAKHANFNSVLFRLLEVR